MDAVKFIRERYRMCRFYHHAGGCYQCPAKDCECSALECMVDDDNIVGIVKEWSDAHPHETRQSVFLKQWPEAELYAEGVLELCPKRVSADYRNDTNLCANRSCDDCRREFWMQEVSPEW